MVQPLPQQYAPPEQYAPPVERSSTSWVFIIALGSFLGLLTFSLFSLIMTFVIFGAIIGTAITEFDHGLTSTTTTTSIEPTP